MQWAEASDVKQLTGHGRSPQSCPKMVLDLCPSRPASPAMETEATLDCSEFFVNYSLVHRSTSVSSEYLFLFLTCPMATVMGHTTLDSWLQAGNHMQLTE